jgi:hypothetical protein
MMSAAHAKLDDVANCATVLGEIQSASCIRRRYNAEVEVTTGRSRALLLIDQLDSPEAGGTREVRSYATRAPGWQMNSIALWVSV